MNTFKTAEQRTIVNTVISTLSVDGRLLHMVQQRGAYIGGLGPAQSPPRCTKCNSPVPTRQRLVYTNFILFDVAL